MPVKLRAHLLLFGVVLVWGTTFVLVKDALADISPLLFNLIRMALATVCLALVYRKQLRRLTPAVAGWGAVAGLLLTLGYHFQTAGLALTTPSKSAFLTGLTVVLVPLLCVVPRLRVPGSAGPGWNAYGGAAMAFLGIALLTGPATQPHGAGTSDWPALALQLNRGDVLTLACALSFALHLITLSHLAHKIRFEQLALLQIGFSTVFMGLSLPILETPRFHLSGRLIVALLISSVLSTAAAFTIQSWAQQHLAATHTALILAAEPVFAWLTSLLVLHQGLAGKQAAGALLILAGIGLTELFTVKVQNEAASGL